MLHRQQNRSLCYATEINVWIFCFAEPYALTFSQQFISISFFLCMAIFHNVAHYPLSAIHIAGGDGLI